MKTIHMVCNAHLDPVWLWEWEEGAAEAVTTFRTAAEMCERNPGFIFNHNEALLYQWVEEYDPALFARIRRLVRAGRWHIMGGWYLQPDCNMPCGESFVRQVLTGRLYFQKAFGVAPTVAINFDPFGHTRGLVQILAKSGYQGYLFTRPDQVGCALEKDAFVWEGYDGSRVLAVRARDSYRSLLGEAGAKLRKFLKESRDVPCEIFLWGVGNHGGGPSRQDLRDLNLAIKRERHVRLQHATPETYFKQLQKQAATLPVRRADLNAWAVGCYTSQIRIKQTHRALESALWMTEKMAAAAWVNGLQPYPRAELAAAGRDLAFAQFHDILPGSSIQPVEETSLRLMHHGLEILSRAKARAFFALAQGVPPGPAGTLPVLVYNPHPHPVRTTVVCEFQLAEQNWSDTFTDIEVAHGKRALPAQVETELSNLNLDWRKRVAFCADLAPGAMHRFDCRPRVRPKRPRPQLAARQGRLRFRTRELDVVINARTGLIDRYRVGGRDYLEPRAGLGLVIADNADPWCELPRSFRSRAGAFRLLSPRASAAFAGVDAARLAPVRVIEQGPVRTVIEALFGFGHSRMCVRYRLPQEGACVEVEVRAYWHEPNHMLKLAWPTPFRDGRLRGQVAYGADWLPADGRETVAQQWAAVVSGDGRDALTVINDGTYGLDCRAGELRSSLLRSPSYSGLTLMKRPVVPQDRLSPRIDQGERLFRFWIEGGRAGARLDAVSREAAVLHEAPMALSCSPGGSGAAARPLLELSDKVVLATAVKLAETNDDVVIRLFEPTGKARVITVALPVAGLRRTVRMGGFEIKTLSVNLKRKRWAECDLLERPVVRVPHAG